MNRLSAELQRLYEAPDDAAATRALVLELARPADWEALARLWRGVQADLGLPAPAIAVNGRDGYQLWFSLAQPLPAAQGLVLLEGLRARYLGEVAPARVGLSVAPAVPRQLGEERWSAFVAPDLAPVFADEPWLDTPPGAEGQADLLARLASIKPAALQQALQDLAPAAPTVAAAPSSASLDPHSFLLQVMNDASAPLALRIEAAKALLPLPARR